MEKLYYNGKIITMEAENGQAELADAPQAVLVRDGVIASVGTMAEVEAAADKKAERVDLAGKCLMPSFIDPHSHVTMNGQMSQCARLGDCESYQDIIDTLKKYIDDHKIKAGGAVIGFGYDHNFLKEGRQPDRRVLDQVSTKIPILIMHVSSHLACCNSKALEMAGITADTPNPAGGVIGRLEDGREPSGYLEEGGMMLVQKLIGKKIKPDIPAMIKGMQENYIQYGVTTVQDGATTAADLMMLKGMALAGQLKIDVVAYLLMSSDGVKLLHDNQKWVREYHHRLKIGGYKLVLDGSPQGRSAWMSEPYLGGDPEYFGYPWMKDEQVEQFVKIAIEEHQQLLAHCNGDAASEQYLNAYEKALRENGNKEDLRPVMIHCQTVRNDQLDRMAKINMIASIFVGHVFYWGDVHKRNLGEKRGNHISPARDAMDRGITVNFHQDTPVTKPDMMHSVWAAVNRISRNGDVIGEDQAVTVYEALKAVTINGAYQYFEEGSKGSIKAGKRADLVILEKSPLEVKKMEIRSIKVMETIKDGKTIYKA